MIAHGSIWYGFPVAQARTITRGVFQAPKSPFFVIFPKTRAFLNVYKLTLHF